MSESERRIRTMAGLRAASLAAALLALAGLALPFPTRARTLVLLIDVSDSIGREGIEASRRAALGLVRSLERRDRVAAIAFAGRATVVMAPVPPAQAEATLEAATLSAAPGSELAPESTDLSGALAAATALAATGPGGKTVFVFSDGRSNAGRALAEGLPAGPSRASAAIDAVAIDAVPVGRAAVGVVAVGLSAPESSHPGEKVALSWRLYSSTARTIRYKLRVDGRVAAKGMAALAAGVNEIPLALDAGTGGRRTLLAEALPTGPSAGQAPLARSGAHLEVGTPADILVVSEGASPIPAALRAQGMRVEVGGAELLPEEAGGYAGRAAVVLDNLPALAMTEAQQARLQDYAAGGGGLLVIGGESSLGRGEYYATPLEELLPVETDSRQRLLFTRSRLLFVIDHSGSMGEKLGAESKQMIAMRGVAASLAELNPVDEVGILGFDSSPAWVIPFTPVSEREKILSSLSLLGDGGGTDLAVALEEALRSFGEPGPTRRHAIVLTDGLTPEADFRGLCARFRAAGVSVSTIAIGEEVNQTLLRNLAEWSGGAYYRGVPGQIPALIAKETLRMTRDLVQEGRIDTRIAGATPAVEGLGPTLPAVGGYLLTTLKPLAASLIEARASVSSGMAAGGGTWDPLLASWRYGSGRVAVFASDSGRRWLTPWAGTEAYNRLWSQVIRSIERAAPEGRLRARASVEEGEARVVVEATGKDRRALSSLRLVGRSGGLPFSLDEVAPGRYEGSFPLASEGLVDFDLLDPVSGARASAWVWSPPLPESASLGPDEAALSHIASASGGRLLGLDELAPPRPVTRWEGRSLRLPLLVLAVLLLVAELYLRSTMTGQVARALASFGAWWRAQAAVAASSRAGRWPGPEPGRDADRERRNAEMQRRLAEHVSRRYQAKEATDERVD